MKIRTMVLCVALTVLLASAVQAGLTVTCTNCSEKLIQILDRVTNVELHVKILSQSSPKLEAHIYF